MNEQEIREIVEEEHRLVLLILKHENVYPKWIHPYKSLQFINTKASYGKANSKGIVKISRVFLNTREYAKLRDTIRHEFAHLIVGNNRKHDYAWKYIAHLIGADPKATHKATGQLANRMRRKWRLIGILEDGTEVAFHTSHNKMSKYLKYKHERDNWTCRQGNIVKFHYVRNKDDHENET